MQQLYDFEKSIKTANLAAIWQRFRHRWRKAIEDMDELVMTNLLYHHKLPPYLREQFLEILRGVLLHLERPLTDRELTALGEVREHLKETDLLRVRICWRLRKEAVRAAQRKAHADTE